MEEQIAQKPLDYMQSTSDFMLKQAPEVIQQALRYKKVSTCVSIVLTLVLMSLAIYIGLHFYNHPTLDKYASWTHTSVMEVAVPLMLTSMLFLQLCISVDKLIKI